MWTSWDRNYRLHARLRGRDEQMIRYNVLLDSVNVDPLKQMFFRDLNLSPHYAFRFLDGGGWTGRTQ